MTNELTRVIMKNIVDRCTDIKRNDTSKIHIDNREVNMLRDIIHKENSVSVNTKSNTRPESKGGSKHVTLDELINKSVKDNKSPESSGSEKIKDPYKKGINKVSLDDIVPKVSLSSIGKKR